MMTVATVMQFLEQFAPPRLAADWDNVGLLLGDRDSPVQNIMTCLTVTPETAAEAIAAGVNLIVTHHPVLFRAIKKLTTATSEGRMLLSLLRANIAVYCPHTSFDNTEGGINEMIARRLGLIETGPLRRSPGVPQYKIVVFVPDADLHRLSDAMFAAGAGQIGQYSQCSFRLSGTGTFFGSETTNPTVGQKGRREEVSEWRLEVICPESKLEAVLQAMRKSHSYEEPAYDVYPLKPGLASPGEGRNGRLPKPLSLGELARQTGTALKTPLVQIVGEPGRVVERLGIVCGAGGDLLADAMHSRVDVFLTGELRFHDYLAARSQGLSLLLPGHYATERFGVEELATRLQQQWPDVKIWPAKSETDPVSWVVL
jgi:dinuclear metal center YbgI/SA1388 family protein